MTSERRVVFWSTSPDEEGLSHESVLEAVDHFLDEVVDLSKVEWPLVVFGWARREVSDKELEGLGESLAERAEEWLDEEFGGDDYGRHRVLDDDAERRLAKVMAAALVAEREQGGITSWQCEVVESRAVTMAEAMAWSPHLPWFTE